MIAVVRAFSALEPRHWMAVGASVALHLGVILGWQPEPPAEPRAVSFEITLEPPGTTRLPASKTKSVSKKTESRKLAQKAKRKILATKNKASPDPVQREPHLIAAEWRTESKSGAQGSAPALTLPDARTLGIENHIPATQQMLNQANGKPQSGRAVEASARANASAASESNPGLSEPSLAASSNERGRPAEIGVSLASSPALTGGQGINLAAGSSGAQASSVAASLSGTADPAGIGDRHGGLQTSAAPQAALSSIPGTGGLQPAATPAALAAQGARSDGVRLTASGVLAGIAALPAGAGSQAADSPTSAPAQGGNAAQSSPAAMNPAGRGVLQGSAITTTGTANTMPGRSGSAQVSARDTAIGQSGQGREARSHLGVATRASTALMGATQAGITPGRSGQSAESIALAPGEPGSSPSFAITLQPVVASLGNPYLQNRAGKAAGAGNSEPSSGVGHAVARAPIEASTKSDSRSLLNNTPIGSGHSSAISPAAASAGSPGISAVSGQAAAAAVLNAARESGHTAVVLKAVQAVPVKVVRPDTEIQRLDVLAPSNYCPLPLPGHNQPDNRAPQATHNMAERPAYALDNPSISYPVLANIRGVEGRVTVRVEVLADGRPGKMWLKQSSGSGILDHDAQNQLKQWRFMPARMSGQPVSAWIDIPVLYRLNDSR